MVRTARLKLCAFFEACVSVAIQAFSQAPIKPLALEACDLIILPAVVRENFAACAPERGEVVSCGPGADVGGVEGIGGCGVKDGEGGGVPGGIGVDGVFEPVLCGGDVSGGSGRREKMWYVKGEKDKGN